MNEFIEQFLIECRELVGQATSDLLALEQDPADRERLDGAFRAIHTLKGSAGIVEFAEMGRALHAAEDVLSAVRAGESEITPALISDCLSCVDQVDQWLDAMEASGELPTDAGPAADAMVARFARAAASDPPANSTPTADPAKWWSGLGRIPGAQTAIRYVPDADCFFRGEDPLALIAELPGLLTLDLGVTEPWPAIETMDPFVCRLALTATSAAAPAEVATYLVAVQGQFELRPFGNSDGSNLPEAARKILKAQILLAAQGAADGLAGRLSAAARTAANVLRHAGRPADTQRLDEMAQAGVDAATLVQVINEALKAGPAAAGGQSPGAPIVERVGASDLAARALRVDVERIDALVRLTGELTVVKNALGHAVAQAEAVNADQKALAPLLKGQHAQLVRLVDELQRSVLSIRVLPLRHVFQRFPRLVREMANGLGRQVKLVTEGEDTEADKAVVENLYEPLLHVLRNAVDHGVEPPEQRTAAGKPAQATLVLRAARQGDKVVVEVQDDGRGVDVARVRQVAGQRGVAEPTALAAMSDAEVADLVFAPGFSTATEVTDLSGRGVGMDAVRAALDRLGGRVQLLSEARKGTTVRFVLPFTLMMTRVMTVEAGGQVFGLPLEAVVETVKIGNDQISRIGAARAFVHRNQTAPIIDLGESLGVAPTAPQAAEASIVLASVNGQLVGLQVDRVGARLDVMLKAMDGLLSGMPGVAGATLLGDGRVLIVLDLHELFQ